MILFWLVPAEQLRISKKSFVRTEVVVWIAVTYATVIVYEVVRRWQSSGKRMRHAFLGQSAPKKALASG